MCISQETIDRLKKSREEYEANEQENSLELGRNWAEHEADWGDIMAIATIDVSNADITDLKQVIEDAGYDSVEDQISRMFGVNANLIDLIGPERVRAFLQGVVEVRTAVIEAP